MNKNRAIIAAISVAAVLVAGCASVAVTDDVIERNTAQALGLAKGSFAISERTNDGVKASYNVKTNTGKQYACYVTGGVGIVGRVVSDPICTEIAKPGKQAASGATGNASCNPLLKAAGKCQ